MTNKKELTEIKEWVVVEGFNVHQYDTFIEALRSPIRGHVMTKQYYEFHYRQD